jgi:hypothetical protein
MGSRIQGEQPTYTLPAFNYLMISNAAMTIIELPKYLDNVAVALAKLQQVNHVVKQSGKEDSVLEWAVNVMTRIASDG